MLLFGDVDVHVVGTGVLADDHALVNLLGGFDKERHALLQRDHCEGRGGSRTVGDDRAVDAGDDFARPRLVAVRDRVGDARTAGDGEKFGAEADEPTRGDDELHAHPSGAVVAHPIHPALASREKLGDRAEVLFRRVDREVLERLVDLAVDSLRDHLWLADRELETFTTHLLDEDREREFTSTLHLPGIRAPDVDEFDGDVTDQFTVETVFDHPGGELMALDLADHGRGVRADGHRDRRIVDLDGRQRAHVVGVCEGLADGDVFEPCDRDDISGASGFGRKPVQRFGDEQLGDLHVPNRAIVLDPRDGLALLDRAVEDPKQRESAQEGRRVEVGDVRLQGVRVVECGRRDVLEDGVEQRLEVAVVWQGAVGRFVPARGAVAPGGIHDGNVEDGIEVEVWDVVGHVAGETEQQILALGDDLVDPGIRPVGLVDQQDHGQLGFERFTQHEPGLRQRALARVDEQNNTVDHAESALDLTAEVGVAGGVDDIDRDGSTIAVLGRMNAFVRHRRVLGENGDAFFALEVVRVHGALFEMSVLRKGVRLAEHGIDQGGLAVVDVGDDCDVAQVGAGGDGHECIP